MLKLEADKLWEHFEESKEYRDRHLQTESATIERMHGSGYKGDNPSASSANHQAEWLSVMLPRLMYRDPRVTAVAHAAGTDQSATAMAYAMNRISRQQRLGEFLQPVARDYSLYWSAVFVSNKRHPGMSAEVGDDSWMPQAQHLNWSQFGMDPHAGSIREARYTWHTWVADRDDLIEQAEQDKADGDDSWDIAAIEHAVADTGMKEVGGDERKVKREEIVAVEFWVRDAKVDKTLTSEDGFNGVICTLCVSGDSKGKFLRKPRDYYGHPRGPHVLFGCYSVPKDPWPLAPLRMSEPQELAAMRMADVVNHAALTYRRVLLVPAGSKDKAAIRKALRTTRIDEVIEVSGLTPDAKPISVEIGGVTDQMLKNKAVLDQQLQDISGLDSQQVGRADPKATATAAAIADTNVQTRAEFIIDQFHCGVRDLLERMAWFVWSDDRVIVPLGQDAQQALGMPTMGAAWQGGETMPFESLDLQLDMMSVSRVTEPLHQRRVLQAVSLIPQLVPQIRMFPEVEWPKILSMLGEALGMPDLGSVVNVEFAMQLAGMQGAPQQAEQPRMGGDLGLKNGLDLGARSERMETPGRMMGAAMGVA